MRRAATPLLTVVLLFGPLSNAVASSCNADGVWSGSFVSTNQDSGYRWKSDIQIEISGQSGNVLLKNGNYSWDTSVRVEGDDVFLFINDGERNFRMEGGGDDCEMNASYPTVRVGNSVVHSIDLAKE